jgi:hypothetical protein
MTLPQPSIAPNERYLEFMQRRLREYRDAGIKPKAAMIAAAREVPLTLRCRH